MRDRADEQEAILAALRGAPAWVTPEAMKDTLKTFRPYCGTNMTPGDALEILINVGNLFELLAEKPRSPVL